jgi:hypothetical protein
VDSFIEHTKYFGYTYLIFSREQMPMEDIPANQHQGSRPILGYVLYRLLHLLTTCLSVYNLLANSLQTTLKFTVARQVTNRRVQEDIKLINRMQMVIFGFKVVQVVSLQPP